MTKNDSISIRVSGIYIELAKVLEGFQNIMKILNEIEEIIEDKKRGEARQ